VSLLKAIAVSAMWVISSAAFAADVYVCEKNGRKEFSQLPCGDNAVILKTEGEPNSLKISMPMKPKEVAALCQLVIKAKDMAVKNQKNNYERAQRNYNRHNYNYNYNNNSGGGRDTPQAYVLSHIANLEQIAEKSPPLYQLIKGLASNVYYQGYEDSPIYEAERAAALTNCKDNLNERMEYAQRYE
jgi:hypothetical protein